MSCGLISFLTSLSRRMKKANKMMHILSPVKLFKILLRIGLVKAEEEILSKTITRTMEEMRPEMEEVERLEDQVQIHLISNEILIYDNNDTTLG